MSYPKKTSRETILAHAMAHVQAHGAAGLSMRTLAGDLGVTPNALYRYFASKAELEYAIADEVGKLLLAALEKAAAKKPAPGAIVDVAKAYIRFAHKHPEWYALKMRYCDDDGSEPDSHTDIWGFVMNLAASVPTRWKAEDLALTLWAFLHGMVELARADLLDGRKPENAIGVGLDVMLAGLMAGSTATVDSKRELGH
ncbi:MAG: TetR/AcrR family transcriptional regulator [Aquabacterium sp.]